MDTAHRLHALESLPMEARLDGLVALASEPTGPHTQALREALLAVVDSTHGDARRRMLVGEALGRIGDPRLRRAADPDYWVTVESDLGNIVIGRHLVTNAEYAEWAENGGYTDKSSWTEDGLVWLAATPDPWTRHAKDPASDSFTVPNQPVVGVTLHEALAYAAAHGARLPRSDERVWVCRGKEKRPYPWGSPFGEGNANTREEVLGRPCAVGLYPKDRTPEGVTDLAGNVAEWMSDDVGGQRLVHPGAWDQPSMAAWAKALALHSADARWAGLGFRLARDAV